MTIRHHPGDELLLSYASGAANEAVSLLVASHLALCASCRAAVAGAEAAGGSLLARVPPVALGEDAYRAVLSRLDAPSARIVRQANLEGDVPAPLQPYIGVSFDACTKRAVVVSAIDNLVKGAAGQAIQNLNLALGIEETAGLL